VRHVLYLGKLSMSSPVGKPKHHSSSAKAPASGRRLGMRVCRVATSLAATGAIAVATSAWPLGSGDTAPACSVPSLEGGRSVSLADYRGSVVYLDFWASWCGPCRESFPFMNELDREFRDQGLAIVAVSVDKTAEDARRFVAHYPARFALAIDVAAHCPSAYDLPGMPTSYLIDRSGSIRAVHAGFRTGDKAEIRRQVVEALARP
jgi:cytochrome c biogenesis protein CcmG, thiol:disulfide interchange protein DsbE